MERVVQRKRQWKRRWCWAGVLLWPGLPALAHDPVFGLGPHTLFKGAVEVHVGVDRSAAGARDQRVATLELAYGVTANWTLRAELPYLARDGAGDGLSDFALATKYRFWRRDGLGVQESASVLLRLKTDSAGRAQGTDTTDVLGGIAYGYESRKWYRWAALRYLSRGETGAGLERGDRLLADLVLGIRFRQTAYLEPDWVWMVELNGERTGRDELDGRRLPDSGGTRWFVSPGLMWTWRNFAVKTGMQIPLAEDLDGTQPETDYRARLELEWHF